MAGDGVLRGAERGSDREWCDSPNGVQRIATVNHGSTTDGLAFSLAQRLASLTCSDLESLSRSDARVCIEQLSGGPAESGERAIRHYALSLVRRLTSWLSQSLRTAASSTSARAYSGCSSAAARSQCCSSLSGWILAAS
jgi:hypothetical protein